MQIYINEENNRRRNLLQKYINLCTDAKVREFTFVDILSQYLHKKIAYVCFGFWLQVVVDTMLVESNAVAKAILDLIPVVNITNLVMGTNRPPSTRYYTLCRYFSSV